MIFKIENLGLIKRAEVYLDKSDGNAHNMLDSLREQVDRYPQPIQDNLEIAEDLVFLSRNHSEFDYLANELEQLPPLIKLWII
ncbi:MAG: hypothetical protein DRR16_11620 [Candidatus Parabeggiatoa sp. nov. 3]|nr:MAG: hypothetical protein DRR00_29560 [Gammaproteobacteria bacterium]RKZ61003.1 MAG: hypothetical protein DRQ99_21175 [Gammaproteobacteria bacterium]RKZ85615.1 MAG: hypothetical protein DRR16_11620 [Gammaproteobacteria bacterium]